MPITPHQFWESLPIVTLRSIEDVANLRAHVESQHPQADTKTIAKFLVQRNVLTRYQAKYLLNDQHASLTVGDYLLIDQIRDGRLAGTYAALHRPTHHPVAIVRIEYHPPPDALTQPRHPRLLRIFEVLPKKTAALVVFQRLAGTTAADRGAGQGGSRQKQALALAYQLLAALAALHEHDRAHGAVTPDNVWLTESNTLILLTFPLIPAVPPPPTPAALASAKRDDVLAAGSTISHLLGTNASLPPHVATWLGYLLADDPANRYPHATAARDALRPYVDQPDDLLLPEPPSPTEQQYLAQLDETSTTPAETVAAVDAVAEPQPAAPASSSIDPADSVVARARRTRSSARRAGTLVATFVVALIGLAATLYYLARPTPTVSEAPPTTDAPESPSSDTPTANEPTPATPPHDDGSLWASPTDGPPLDLRFLPPGTQMVVALRPSALATRPEFEKLLAALGPAARHIRDELPARAAHSLAQIDSAIIGFSARAEEIQTAWVIRLHEPAGLAHLMSAWNNPAAETAAGQTVYRGDEFTYLVPELEGRRLIAVVPAAEAQSVLDAAGAPPPFRPAITSLIETTDRDRLLTVVATPTFLFGDGRTLLATTLPGLSEPLDQLFSNDVAAFTLSLHLADDLFCEFRLAPAQGTSPRALLRRFSATLNELPDDLDPAALDTTSDDFRAHAPQMLAAFAEFTRFTADRRHAITRTYLPTPAAHNLALLARLIGTAPTTGENASATDNP